MVDIAAEELQKARDMLADADAIRDVGVTDETIVNRLYYACFHAAQAVLYRRGFEPETHQAVLSLFGEEVVLPGDAAPEDGRLLNDLRDLRVQADYRHDPIDADISHLFERTETFVAEMDDLM